MTPLSLAARGLGPALLALGLVACGGGEVETSGGAGGGAGAARFDWKLPAGFPEPVVPADNAMTAEKVELGRRLFYDRRLSGKGTYACSSCHHPQLAFADPRGHAVGESGDVHPRGSMSLVNVAYAKTLTWADPRITSLESQALVPMFGGHPRELGLAGMEGTLIERLSAEPLYQELFARAFPAESPPISLGAITRALACFERSLVGGRSPYDRFAQGEEQALTPSARLGLSLFEGDRLGCRLCHGGFTFAEPSAAAGDPATPPGFHNTGLYNLDGEGAFPADNTGLFSVTGKPADMGKFRAPTLRNVALTAPYFHDGSAATLGEVIDHYAQGGRTIASGPNAGVGRDSPLKSRLITGFSLSDEERQALLDFFDGLTDDEITHRPELTDPWPR